MGSFAKKIGRVQKMRSKALMKDAVKEGRKLRAATNQVMDLTAEQMVNDLLVEADAIDDVSTILLLASNRAFGFGAKRIGELNKKMFTHYDCIQDKLVTMRDIDKILLDEANLDIQDDREAVEEKYKDYERYFQITRKVMDELSSCWLLALHDEFNFKAKRLARGYHEAGKISVALKEKRLSSEDLHKELYRIKMRGKAA